MLKLKNMRPGEEVELVLKRHWIVFVILGIYFSIAIIISLVLFIILGFTTLNILLNIIFWLFFSIFMYIEWLNHELDMYVVTNNRIIGVEQISFLNRSVSECNLGQVQEVNANTKGIFANMLNYGTVRIQTAGASANMIMEFVPDGLQAQRKVLNIVDQYRDKHNPPTTFATTQEETHS